MNTRVDRAKKLLTPFGPCASPICLLLVSQNFGRLIIKLYIGIYMYDSIACFLARGVVSNVNAFYYDSYNIFFVSIVLSVLPANPGITPTRIYYY